ncbi:hypothetical protein DL89DRAFT_264391 [Linderina pennispora]|uniref:Uncharacterized protein n=1 Tax=Linderina pennispora TaxID=61395 RepID=A0A1Y1WMW9_9FUNG|nr:uncharacterized protein DL89DRAFT_264391 [Linderina pennispora]ORX74546.1 hypothetical protein DL89DRAFT_264391 [Linderina pennispora]
MVLHRRWALAVRGRLTLFARSSGGVRWRRARSTAPPTTPERQTPPTANAAIMAQSKAAGSGGSRRWNRLYIRLDISSEEIGLASSKV